MKTDFYLSAAPTTHYHYIDIDRSVSCLRAWSFPAFVTVYEVVVVVLVHFLSLVAHIPFLPYIACLLYEP